MPDFNNLRVWQESMKLAKHCYEATRRFPADERFGMTSQMRRSATSVPSNIAEGSGRGSDREFRRFLRIAYGSACELETQARLATAVGIAGAADMDEIISRSGTVRRMLSGLIGELGGPMAS